MLLVTNLLSLLLAGKLVFGIDPVNLKGGAETDDLLAELGKDGATTQQVIPELEELAKADNPDALYILGRWSEEGRGTQRNVQNAAAFYKKANDLGHVAAGNNLGLLMLASANGNRERIAEGAALVKKASDSGLALAQRNYAALLSSGSGVEQDHELARGMIEKLVNEKKDGEAALLLARLWEGSNGHPRDEAKAIAALRQAAEFKSSRALQELGQREIQGVGVEKNVGGGVGHLVEASGLGNPVASRELGLICEAGLHGTTADLDKARGYYELAAKGGDGFALNKLGMFTEGGTAGIPADPQKALNLYRRSAQAGFGGGHANVGRFYQAGAIVDADPSKAFSHFLAAAGSGIAEAQFFVAQGYEAGRGTRKDLIAAVAWYDRAARSGLPTAQLILAGFFEQGRVMDRNPESAANLLSLASEAGDSRAQFRLANYYKNGFGVEKDPVKAYVLATKAGESIPQAKTYADGLKATLSEAQTAEAATQLK